MARNSIIREPNPKVPTDQESPHGCYEGWVYLGFDGDDKQNALNELRILEEDAENRLRRWEREHGISK
jgi:hypothetical protein